MRLYHLLLAAVVTCLIKAQDEQAPGLEDYERRLDEAALQVLQQHRYDQASSAPPDFDPKRDFMRSAGPDTGVGNREDLIITNIRQIPMFDDSSFSKWRYKRYNNSDFVMGMSATRTVLQKIDKLTDDYFLFTHDDAVLQYATDARSVIVDVTMFSVYVRRVEVLYVALLTESTTSSLVTIYEIVANKAVLVTLLDLGFSPIKGIDSAKKISFVQSQQRGSIVVLISDTKKSNIIYQRKGSSELSHYIEVHFPGALDMVTFTIHGRGYIAVANGTVSEIFKMDEFAQSHLLFERIDVHEDMANLDYFRLGFQHYLAVAGEGSQSLYVWRSGGFFLKQVFLDSVGVRQLHSAVLPTCRDDVILLFVRRQQVDVYVWSGRREEFVSVKGVFPPGLVSQPGSMTSFANKNKAFLLFLDYQGLSQVYTVETNLNPVTDPVLTTVQYVSEVMRNLQAMLDDQSRQLKNISEILLYAVRPDGDQRLSSFQSFVNLTSTQETVVQSVEETRTVQWEGSNLSLEEYKTGTAELEKTVAELEASLKDMEERMSDVVLLDEDALIKGSKRFTGDVSASLLFAHSISLKSVGGIDIPQLQKDIYRLDKPQQIKGNLTFEKPLTVAENLDVEGTINGVDISEDVMTTDTEQISTAEMVFPNKLVVIGDLNLTGKLNGIDIGEEVVTLYGNHTITGYKTFQNGIVANRVETKLLDGVEIQTMFDTALTQGGDQSIPGTVNFMGGMSTNNIVLSGTINGYDVKELAADIVRIDTPDTIIGHKTFLDDVIVKGSLTVGGTVNDLRIPEDLLLASRSQVVTGVKRFMGQVIAGDVKVDGTVDGLKLPDDIVTLTGDETIQSTLHFTDGISVVGDVTVHGLVDDVDVSQLAKDALKLNETRHIENAVFLGPVTITEDLAVQGTVNAMTLSNLVDDIVFKDDVEIVIDSEKRFKKVVADSVYVKQMINGYNINEDFMTVRGNQTISGTKVFKKPVTFTSINTKDNLIDGINIVELYENRVTLSVDDDVMGDVEFTDHLIVDGDLTLHGTLNGLVIPDDVVLRNVPGDQAIANKVFEDPVRVDHLLVEGDLDVPGPFGGVRLPDFASSRVTLQGDQVIEGDVWLGGETAVDRAEVSGRVNGRDMAAFARSVMSLGRDQDVTAAKEFAGTVTINGPITTKNGVNGVDLAHLKARAFKLNEVNYVTAPFEFEGIVVNNVTVDGAVNGVDIARLDADSLKTKGLQHVTGENAFLSGFHVEGDIVATTLNDMVIDRDILLKDVEQTITGKYTVGDVIVDGNVDVAGLVNGLDLSEISPLLARTDADSVVVSNLTFKAPVHVLRDIEVTGLVNYVNLKELSETSLLKGGDQVVSGHKVLRGNVTILGDVDVAFVNGVNWTEFLSDVVRTDVPQIINSPKSLESDSEVKGDVFVTGLAEVGLINGVDLDQFVKDAVFVDEPANITGKKIFTSTMQISGDLDAELINGLRLRTDVVTLTCSGDSPQVIKGKKTFSNLTVLGNINVAGLVNGYNLQQLYGDTLLTEGDQTVLGRKTIKAPVRFMKNVYPDTVNGFVLSRDLVTLHGDHAIAGPLAFSGDLVVDGDLDMSGLLNGVDVRRLSGEALSLHTEQDVDGAYTLRSAAAAADVEVAGDVNGLRLRHFDDNVTRFWRDVDVAVREQGREVGDQCALSQYLHSVLEKSYYVLDGYAARQDLGFPANFIQVGASGRELVLVQSAGPTDSSARVLRYHWGGAGRGYALRGNDTTAVRWSSAYPVAGAVLAVHVGVKAKDSAITVDGSPVESFPRGFKSAAVLVKGKEAVVAFLYPSRGACDVYRVRGLDSVPASPRLEPYGNIIVGREATSAAIFEISRVPYLAFSCRHLPPYSRGASRLYSRSGGEWRVVQDIQAPASSHVQHVLHRGHHYLAFANAVPIYEAKEPKAIQIYRNTGQNQPPFSLFQKVPFDDAKGLDIFEFGGLSELYMTAWNATRVQTFRLEGESGFRTNFTLHGKCITHVKPFVLETKPYLAVAQRSPLPGETVTSVLYSGITQGSMLTKRELKHCTGN